MQSVSISSPSLIITHALTEQLQHAGYECVLTAPVQLTHVGDMLYLARGHDARVELALPVRLSVLLSQLARMTQAPDEVFSFEGGWAFSPSSREISHPVHPSISLTEKEAALLSHLLNAPEKTSERAELLEKVWGYGEEIATHTLETHIYRLRGKLSHALGSEWLHATEAGYKVTL